MENTRKRILYYDVLNVLACFGVVAMHVNGSVYYFEPTGSWLQALVVETVFYWAAPVFFMLSGATLLGYRKRYTTKQFFQKRLLRVGLPFVVWSIIALIFVQTALRNTSLHLQITNPADLIGVFLNARIFGIYWFFIALFAIYLALPVLSVLAQEAYRKLLWYLAAVGFATIFLLQHLLPSLGIPWNPMLDFPLAGGGFIIYAVAGYLLATQEIPKWARYTSYALGLGFVIVRYIFTALQSFDAGALDWAFSGYTAYGPFFTSIAVFIFFKQVDWGRFFNSEKRINVLTTTASASFGIYLIHIFFVFAFTATGYADPRMLYWRLGATFAIYLVTLVLVLGLKRIPLLKHIVP
jgi:surface polysaccharide O-acyltransferase-like enzyme